jgi:hypothetical protein
MSDLDEVLARLSDASAKTTVRGLAVGKTKDQLHLAVRSGVIAIPIAEISDIRHLDFLASGTELVEADVDHPETITTIRRVRPLTTEEKINGASFDYTYGVATFTLTGVEGTETGTITGGPSSPDATDDGPDSPVPDDSLVVEAENAWF